MPHYRLYFLDAAGHIRHAIDLDCEDDAQAVATVATRSDGRAMELWRGAMLVRKFAAERDEA